MADILSLDATAQLQALESKRISAAELLELAVGSLVITSCAAGENVDVLAGGTLLGSGELARANGHRVVRMVDFKGKS